MSDCQGEIALTTKVDAGMNEFIDAAAQQHGVSRAELMRRILDFYRESHQEEMACPACEEPIVMEVE